MPSFGELKPNVYYLIQVDDDSDIELISVLMHTKETVLLRSYLPETEDFFQFSDEPVHRLIEELDAETAAQFETLYAETEAEYVEYEEGEDE